jgi:hypothetical protein
MTLHFHHQRFGYSPLLKGHSLQILLAEIGIVQIDATRNGNGPSRLQSGCATRGDFGVGARFGSTTTNRHGGEGRQGQQGYQRRSGNARNKSLWQAIPRFILRSRLLSMLLGRKTKSFVDLTRAENSEKDTPCKLHDGED